MISIIVIFALLGVGACICIFLFCSKEPTYIGVSIKPTRWILLTLFSFVLVQSAIIGESYAKRALCGIVDNSLFIHVIKKAIENGLLIPFISVFISMIFGECIRIAKMDYLEFYNNDIPKFCLSASTISFCFWLWWLTYNKINEIGYDNNVVDMNINSILMWLITVVGTWMGFGFGCKGRIEKRNELTRKYKLKNIKPLYDKKKFWIPILFALAICNTLSFLAIAYADMLNYALESASISFIVTAIIGAVIYKYKAEPSEDRSFEIFLKAKEKHERLNESKGQVMLQRFRFIDDDLIIEKRNVIYEGHSDDPEFVELFGEKKISLSEVDDVFEFLKNRNRLQQEYIKKCREDCIEEYKNKQIEKVC